MSAAVIICEALALLLCVASAALPCYSYRLLWAAWCCGAVLLGLNAALAESLPFGNMRHVLCFFPLVMAPAAYYLRHAHGEELSRWLAAAAAVALTGALCMPLQAAWRPMPALKSPWFAPHVTSYVVAYGLLAVSALLACRRGEEALRRAALVVRVAFPFLTFGLASGALWADDAWGRYWGWDIKEAWSLLTWLVYAAWFHLRHEPAFLGWRRPLLLLGFACVVITFLIVNFLPSVNSLHSYAN